MIHAAWLLFIAGAGQAAPDPVNRKFEKSCLACHDSARLAAFEKERGPEIIPEDPRERSAFAALMIENDPGRRRTLAEEFLVAYPQSWMLEPVYEIASKASIALNDLPAALDFGSRSLRLLPENPFLLLALVDVSTSLGQTDAAARNARDALLYLDRFDRPTSVDRRTWPQVKTRLKAQATERLHSIYSSLVSNDRTFEQWLASLSPELPAAELPDHPPTPLHRTAQQYAGSQSCRPCHLAQHTNWSATGMGRMFRAYDPKDVIGDFSSGQTVPDDAGKPVARAVVRQGRHYLEIRDGSKWKTYPVDYVIGSKWQQGYATKLPGGEIQVFPLQYNRIERKWVNYWKIIDAPDSVRTDITRFHEVVPGATYQLDCAPCHTSQERFQNGAYQAKAASIREGGVNCEMCHGPSAAHVASERRGHRYAKPAAEPPVDFRRISATEYVAICAQCHMQSGERNPEPSSGAMNYSALGERFYRVLSSRPYVDYSRKAFYKDGRFRETVFIVESFVRSACFRKGGATCGNCHNPHPPDAATNLTSVKYGGDSDRMCLGCHAKVQDRLEAHTHHSAGSEASRCISCHMPRIMNSLLFTARSHQIDDVPDAAMTVRFGQTESPNACLICHKEKDSAWLSATIQSWSVAPAARSRIQ